MKVFPTVEAPPALRKVRINPIWGLSHLFFWLKALQVTCCVSAAEVTVLKKLRINPIWGLNHFLGGKAASGRSLLFHGRGDSTEKTQD